MSPFAAKAQGHSPVFARCGSEQSRTDIIRTIRISLSETWTHHSALMLAVRITLPHFSVSWAISLPNFADVTGKGSIDFLVEPVNDFST
jgi:hypothetical protein